MTPEHWVIAVGCVLLAIAIICLLVDRQLLSPPFVFSASLLIPLLLFKYQLADLTYLLILSAAIAQASGYLLTRVFRNGSHPVLHGIPDLEDNYGRYRLCLLAIFAVGQIGFAVNVARVIARFGIDAYSQVSSKDIELAFGASTATNYLFFTNIAVAALAAWLLAIDRSGRWKVLYLLVGAMSLGCLALSGIKSTVLFGVAIAGFTFLGARRLSHLALAAGVLAFGVLVTAMFAFSNLGVIVIGQGAVTDDLLSRLVEATRAYVYYNYLNLDLEVTLRDTYALGLYTFFMINKLINPGVVGYYDVDEFLVVDKNFNMGTLLREYFVDFGAAGAILIPLIIGMVCGWVVNRKDEGTRLIACVLYGILMTASLFAFFGNQFVRPQFLYVVLIILLIGYLCAKPRHGRLSVDPPC